MNFQFQTWMQLVFPLSLQNVKMSSIYSKSHITLLELHSHRPKAASVEECASSSKSFCLASKFGHSSAVVTKRPVAVAGSACDAPQTISENLG